MRDWFQNTLWIPKSAEAQIPLYKTVAFAHNPCTPSHILEIISRSLIMLNTMPTHHCIPVDSTAPGKFTFCLLELCGFFFPNSFCLWSVEFKDAEPMDMEGKLYTQRNWNLVLKHIHAQPCSKQCLFITAKRWEQPAWPSTDEWVNKVWDSHTVEWHLAMKRNAVFTHATIRMNSQTRQKEGKRPDTNATYCMTPFTWNCQNGPVHQDTI